MLRPKPMYKVRIIALKSITERLISSLHQAGCVDIRKLNFDGLSETQLDVSFDELSQTLSILRPIVPLVEPYVTKKMKDELKNITILKTISAEETSQEATKLFPIAEELKSSEQRIIKIREDLEAIESKIKSLQEFSGFEDLDFQFLSNSRSISFKIGKLSDKKRLDDLISLKDIKIGKNKFNVVLIYPKKLENKVDDILASNFISTEFPSNIRDVQTEINVLKKEQTKLLNEMSEIDKQKEDIALKIFGKLTQIIYHLELMVEQKRIVSRFGSTNKIHIIAGWIVSENLEKLQRIVEKFSPNAYLEKLEYDQYHDTPPTLLDNPSYLKPFEFLTKGYSFPNYNDVDPTLAYAVGVPIVYGMMVGDVIYGFISALIALLFLNKFPKSEIMQSVGKIWFVSALPTILFGLIFNEWAALPLHDLLERIGILGVGEYTPIIHRMHDVMALLLATIGLGILHLTFGFIFGIITEWKHNKKHGIAKIGWLMFMYGIAFALLPTVMGMLAKSSSSHAEVSVADPISSVPVEIVPIGLVLLLIGFILIAWTEGIVGILEIPGLFGNLLSYTRIAAIGIVGVVLAEIINRFVFPSGDIFSIILLIPIYILLHVLNCFLAMFESIIQGGRLNILEFKSKFLHGNGDRFDPFSIKR